MQLLIALEAAIFACANSHWGKAGRSGADPMALLARARFDMRNPPWSRDELIIALDPYLRHREKLPSPGDKEILFAPMVLNPWLSPEELRTLIKSKNG